MPAASEYDQIFNTGVVFRVNTSSNTCDIMRSEGGIIRGVAIMNTSGGIMSSGGSSASDLMGSAVAYTYIDGKPYIIGTVPVPYQPKSITSTKTTDTKTGGGNANTYGSTSEMSYGGAMDTTFSPNDKVFMGDGGACIGLLSGGGLVLKASPMSQIIMGSGMDYTKIVARELSLVTDFGELSFSHGSSGRAGVTFQGGAVYGDEAKAGDGVKTVFMHLGDTPDEPDARFGVRVTDTEGGEFGGFKLSKAGELVFATSKNAWTSIGENSDLLVGGDLTYKVGGGQHMEIAGTSEIDIFGDEDYSVAGKSDSFIGGQETHTVGSDLFLNVGGTLHIGAAGIVLDTQTSGSAGPCTVKSSGVNIIKA